MNIKTGVGFKTTLQVFSSESRGAEIVDFNPELFGENLHQ
jgi:hypothetical protein